MPQSFSDSRAEAAWGPAASLFYSPGMLDSSVADQMARLNLKLLEKVRQPDTRVFNIWLEEHSFKR